MQNWFEIPEPQVQWLIQGLIPADGHAAICGKPKAGKSTFIRNLIVAVIKGDQFLDRSVDLPKGTGRVLYIHLDRKDRDWRVAKELRQLGITQEESSRLVLRTAEHMPKGGFEERLEWLKMETAAAKPNLVVIDLLWQFLEVESANDYTKVLKGINTLQDGLKNIGYSGAMIVALHGRKAVSQTEQFDDMLGSTGQRGSFSTNVMLTHYRREGCYTVASDQTDRDDILGEIPETIINRDPLGTLSLGRPFSELIQQEKRTKTEDNLQGLTQFLEKCPGSDMEGIMQGLAMSKKHILSLIDMWPEAFYKKGTGKKGDPFLYFCKPIDISPQAVTNSLAVKESEMLTHRFLR